MLGKPVPQEVVLAEQNPCFECGAGPGECCKETSSLCWKARLFTRMQWGLITTAYDGRNKNAVGVRDNLYQGLNQLGLHAGIPASDPWGVLKAVRELRKDQVPMLEMMLTRYHLPDSFSGQ
jgi:hypothetical protein